MKRHGESRGDSVRYWTAGQLSAMPLLRAIYFQQSFALHSHEHFVVALTDSGPHGTYCRGRDWWAGPDEITIIGPGDVHSGYGVPGRPWRLRAFYPSVDAMRTAAENLELREPPDLPVVIHRPDIARRLIALHEALEENTTEELEAQSMWLDGVAEMMLAAGRGRGTARQRDSRVERTRDYLHSSYLGRPTLRELAACAGMSQYQLIRRFRRQYGLPPHAYLNALRIDRARTLLRSGVAPADAALGSGFADQSHLSKRFKAVMGVSPGAYALAFRPRPRP